MPTFPDHENFAFSFSHGVIKLNEKQFTAIGNIQLDQQLEEAAVFGTSNKPLRRSAGQLQLGEGTITFTDLEEGQDFFDSLGDRPLMKLFAIDYTVTREDGTTRSIEALSCRLTGFGVDHEQGAEALGIEYPVSFLMMKVNGKELV
jgi:hypothetical protein